MNDFWRLLKALNTVKNIFDITIADIRQNHHEVQIIMQWGWMKFSRHYIASSNQYTQLYNTEIAI